MAQLPDIRTNLYEEELSFKKPVSEATFQKMGSSVNFINNRQYDSHTWHLNGNYGAGSGSYGLDGAFFPLFDMQIVGVSYMCQVGISNVTTFDILKINAFGATVGSIFRDNGVGGRYYPSIFAGYGFAVTKFNDNGDNLENSWYGVVQTANLVALSPDGVRVNFGEQLSFGLRSAAAGGVNCQITIYYRPV